MYCRNCGQPIDDNQPICLNCGVQAGDGKYYCPNCGKSIAEEAVFCVNCGFSMENLRAEREHNMNLSGIKQRSVALAIVLSLITCGIYNIYWFICLTNEMNKASGRTSDTGGAMAFLFTLLTCGIYEYFWAYKLGEKRDIVARKDGYSGVIYLILYFCGFGIIAYALAQDALNKAIAENQ